MSPRFYVSNKAVTIKNLSKPEQPNLIDSLWQNKMVQKMAMLVNPVSKQIQIQELIRQMPEVTPS